MLYVPFIKLNVGNFKRIQVETVVSVYPCVNLHYGIEVFFIFVQRRIIFAIQNIPNRRRLCSFFSLMPRGYSATSINKDINSNMIPASFLL